MQTQFTTSEAVLITLPLPPEEAAGGTIGEGVLGISAVAVGGTCRDIAALGSIFVGPRSAASDLRPYMRWRTRIECHRRSELPRQCNAVQTNWVSYFARCHPLALVKAAPDSASALLSFECTPRAPTILVRARCKRELLLCTSQWRIH